LIWIASTLITNEFELEEIRKRALFSYYPESNIKIVERENNYLDNQICFEFALKARGSPAETKYAMVLGDSDGGSWKFHRTYQSMARCTRNFGWIWGRDDGVE
jgi:hypothetical protein